LTHDVLIVGAGPAGSVTARRLAAAGIRVALIGGRTLAGSEGLSQRSVDLLAEEGVEVGAADGITGPHARRGIWAGGRTVAGSEWLVERGALAATLRRSALAAGADVHHDIVNRLDSQDGLWRAGLRDGGSLLAPITIDARGRRGAERRGPLLLSLGQRFRFSSAHAAERYEGTHIEAMDDGWCWWAVRGQELWVQIVRQARSVTAGSKHPATWLAAAAAQSCALSRLLDEVTPCGAAVARPAHARLAHARLKLPGDGTITRWEVGDAALALDPLSGQGIYEALRGARLVASAVQSALADGDDALAHRFVDERRHEAWAAGVRMAGAHYRENTERGAFWAQTAAAYERLLPPVEPMTACVERRPVLADGRIVEREVVVTAEHPRGVWHVAGVPLVSLKGYLESAPHSTLNAAAAALDRPPPAVAAAIHWLQQAGVMAPSTSPRMPPGG
jgi:menaquinone-9 beta-reductase